MLEERPSDGGMVDAVDLGNLVCVGFGVALSGLICDQPSRKRLDRSQQA